MANRSSNRAAVPEAKGALDKFKYEVASELGVPLTDGYNGDLTSKQNGSVGGSHHCLRIILYKNSFASSSAERFNSDPAASRKEIKKYTVKH